MRVREGDASREAAGYCTTAGGGIEVSTGVWMMLVLTGRCDDGMPGSDIGVQMGDDRHEGEDTSPAVATRVLEVLSCARR